MKETPPSEGVEIPTSPCATARSVAAASAAALAAIAASPPGMVELDRNYKPFNKTFSTIL